MSRVDLLIRGDARDGRIVAPPRGRVVRCGA
jgi:hypothetical protein